MGDFEADQGQEPQTPTDRQLAPRDLGEVSAEDSALTPLPGGEQRAVERFSAGPTVHAVGLTEERGAQIVRQSANARTFVLLAVLLIAVFIPAYWFMESGIPVLGIVGRMEQEALAQAGGELPELAAVTEPGTSGDPRVIRLELTAGLQIVDVEGAPVEALAVQAGEIVRFELENSAGFTHNFYIGEVGELVADQTSDLPGVPAWSTGPRTLEWVVPPGGRLQFACTIPGHYEPMHGDLAIQS